MNLFSDFKAKRQESRKKEIESQATQRIGIKDFDGELFFAVDGTPKEMLATLGTLRENFVKSKLTESRTRGMAVY